MEPAEVIALQPMTVSARRTGDLAPRVDGRLHLEAETEWLLEGTSDQLEAVQHALPREVCSVLGGRVALLRFGNCVGCFDAGPLGQLVVHTRKWSERDYDAMLGQIAKHSAALPFAAGTPSALPYDRTILVHEDVLYHAFTYLRHVLLDATHNQGLLPALHAILRRPHRRLTRTGRVVELGRTRRVDASCLVDVASGRWPLHRSDHPASEPFRGHLPERLEEVVAQHTHDTAENRFVKAFLDLALAVVDRMRSRMDDTKEGSLRSATLAACGEMERVLWPVRRQALWDEVGQMVFFPASSTVLQGQHRYRTVFQAYNRLRLGSRALPLTSAQVNRLMEVKDVALLYELWCCFALIQAVEQALDRPPAKVEAPEGDGLQVTLRWRLRARWPATPSTQRVEVRFNQSCGHGAGAAQSYSVGLRPDLSLRVGAHDHVFDAKFKVDWQLNESDSEETELELQDEERRGQYKRADLYKMHTYRDAIGGVRSAWVLYPGTETTFFCRDGRRIGSAADLPDELDGIGAVPLPANEVGLALLTVVRRIVCDRGPP